MGDGVDVTDIAPPDGARAPTASFARATLEAEALERLARATVVKLDALLSAVEERAGDALERHSGCSRSRQDWEAVSAASALCRVLMSTLKKLSDVVPTNPRLADINTMAGAAEQALGALMGERVKLTWLVGSQPGVVRTTPALWERMLTGLCVGANEAMPNGGTLTVTTRVVSLEQVQARQLSPSATAGAYAVLRVADTGRPRHDGFRRRVVEDFLARQATDVGRFRAPSRPGAEPSSSGFMTLRSTDIGTSVDVYLPLVNSSGDDEADKRRVVLIVEKEPVIRHIVAKELTAAGYRSIETAGWTDALEAVRIEQGRIDTLLIDLGTLGTLGMDLSIRLESLCPTASVVLTSLLDLQRLRERGVDVGTRPMLQKPFGRAELLATLTSASKRRG